jgi:hypothetical protein
LLETIEHPSFREGAATTSFITTYYNEARQPNPPRIRDASLHLEVIAALLFYLRASQQSPAQWRHWQSRPSRYCFDTQERKRTITVTPLAKNAFSITTADSVQRLRLLSLSDNMRRFEQDCIRDSAYFFGPADGVCHPPSARNDKGNTSRACIPVHSGTSDRVARMHGDPWVCALVRDDINFADYISTLIAAPTPSFFSLVLHRGG